MKIFAFERSSETGVFVKPHPHDLGEYMHNPDVLLWIDFYQPNIPWIKKAFALPSYLIDMAVHTSELAYFEQSGGLLFFRIPAFNPDKLLLPGAVANISCFVSEKFVLTIHDKPVEAFSSMDAETDLLAAMCRRGIRYLWLYLLKKIVVCDRQFLDRAMLKIQTVRESIHPDQPDTAAILLDELRKADQYIISLESFAHTVRQLIKKPPSGFKNPSSKRLIRRIYFTVQELMFIARCLEHDVRHLTQTSRMQTIAVRMNAICKYSALLCVIAILFVPAFIILLLYAVRVPVWTIISSGAVLSVVFGIGIYLLIKIMQSSPSKCRLM
ncbi:MAG: CorA family divalent cation transporter [Candidatus Auribacterota bacterium]|jgi:Mg2+ and Co2+ transporter CorA|nr:CorA family divalent cation transporter [Candidatus Auribacterota bacterium]